MRIKAGKKANVKPITNENDITKLIVGDVIMVSLGKRNTPMVLYRTSDGEYSFIERFKTRYESQDSVLEWRAKVGDILAERGNIYFNPSNASLTKHDSDSRFFKKLKLLEDVGLWKWKQHYLIQKVMGKEK